MEASVPPQDHACKTSIDTKDQLVVKSDLKSLSSDFASFLQNELFCDVTFLVGPSKVPFKAHKAILSARSSYFRAMFSSSFAESSKTVLEKPNIEADVFRLILHYVYTGELSVDVSNATPILHAADELQLDGIKSLVFDATFQKSGISEDNIFKYLEDAIMFNCPNIIQFCLEFIEMNAYECLQPERMSILSSEAVLLILQRDDLDLEEEDLFERLIGWATATAPGTPLKSTLRPFISFIRFPRMDATYIATEVEPLGVVPGKLLIEAYKFNLLPDAVEPTPRTHPRRRSWIWDTTNSSPILKIEKGAIIASIDSRWQSALGTQFFSKGRHYFEVHINRQKKIENSWRLNIGLVKDGWDAKKHTVALGYKTTTSCWCLITGRGETLSHRTPSNGQRGTAYGAPCGEGDVIGVLVDFFQKKMEFFRNGVSMGVAFTDIDDAPLRPAISLIGDTQVTLKFGRPPKSMMNLAQSQEGLQPTAPRLVRPPSPVPAHINNAAD